MPEFFISEHEGFSYLLKHVEKLKIEVWKNHKTRDYGRMRTAALEVAAMAVKFNQGVHLNLPPGPVDPSGLINEIMTELERARSLGFGLFNSPHEGFAVLLEEVDELKAEVWADQKERDARRVYKEAIEVAAMGIKFVKSLDEHTG